MNKKKFIHLFIGLAIMILFRFIPVGILPNVTEIGMQVIGVFIGTIYLWTTIDPMTSSLISIIMLALTDYADSATLLTSVFGNSTVIQVFFLTIFTGAVTNRRLTVYIARWIMTRKFVEGRPWVFTFVMLLGSYLLGAFINCFVPIFLFWPVLYDVYEQVGYKKTDAYPKLMTLCVVIAALLGFPVAPYMQNGLALLTNYRGLLESYPTLASMAGVTISNGSYFIGCFVLGIILVVVTTLVMRFIFRPNVEPLKKITIEMLEKNPLPPMNFAQKVLGVSLIVFIFMMLVPSLLPNVPGLSFLNQNSVAMIVLLVTLLCFIPAEDGPVLKINEVMGKEFAWPTYFLIAAAIILGSVLTNEATGVTAFLNAVLSPIFSGMSTMTFTVLFLVICVLLTNICNSLVIGMIMQPVILTYCATALVNPAPLITLLIYTVLSSAACTPAASPFAAMLFGNKEYLTSGDIYKYSVIFVAFNVAVILIVGIPFINILL
ncbi:MAG: anion permease [Erysipelotrichaceae bacterium]|nr:anion permease [Erysipelotrichaceae bacterium]